MFSPLVSIIIPVFNSEDYLRECLDSVLNQTYKNIEIILVNDGSTDNSAKILKKYALENDNIVLINQNNHGQSFARNVGLDYAKGKYIYFLDSDDYILSDMIRQLITKMEKYNLEIIRFGGKSFTDHHQYKKEMNRYDYKDKFDKNKLYKKEEFLNACKEAYTPSPVLYITKRDVLLKNNIKFDLDLKKFEDEIFTLTLFLNIRKAMYEPNIYYMRRYRPDSLMTSSIEEDPMEIFNLNYKVVKKIKNLKSVYTKAEQLNLINERIRINRKKLFLIKEVDGTYKKKKIKELSNLTNQGYYILLMYYKIRNCIRRIKK